MSYYRNMTTTSDAVKAEDVDEDDLPIHHIIRECIICSQRYVVNLAYPNEAVRIYCTVKCKNRGKDIRKIMRNRGFEPDVEAYVADPSKFSGNGKSPELPPRVPTYIPAITPTLRHSLNADIKRNEAIASKQNAERAKARTKIESMRLKQTELRHNAIEAASKEREAIQATVSALNLIPLSEAQPEPLTPTQLDSLRSGITHIVNQQLLIVDKVFSGEVTWNTTQASLFKTLISKVLPDAAATKLPTNKNTSISELTIEELEQIVATQSKEKLIV